MRGVCFIFSSDEALLRNRISLYITGENYRFGEVTLYRESYRSDLFI